MYCFDTCRPLGVNEALGRIVVLACEFPSHLVQLHDHGVGNARELNQVTCGVPYVVELDRPMLGV